MAKPLSTSSSTPLASLSRGALVFGGERARRLVGLDGGVGAECGGQHRRQLDVAHAARWRPRPRARRCRAPPIMSSLAAGQGCSRSTPMRGDAGVRAVDAQIAAADGGGGEGHVGDARREQARGVEMPGHAFHADGRQQPVRRLEAGDAAVARGPDHRAAGLACRSRSGRSPRRRRRPSPTTSRPACARGFADCGSCPDRDGRTRW